MAQELYSLGSREMVNQQGGRENVNASGFEGEVVRIGLDHQDPFKTRKPFLDPAQDLMIAIHQGQTDRNSFLPTAPEHLQRNIGAPASHIGKVDRPCFSCQQWKKVGNQGSRSAEKAVYLLQIAIAVGKLFECIGVPIHDFRLDTPWQ